MRWSEITALSAHSKVVKRFKVEGNMEIGGYKLILMALKKDENWAS